MAFDLDPNKKKKLDPDAEARQMMLDKSMVPAAKPVKAPQPLANGANVKPALPPKPVTPAPTAPPAPGTVGSTNAAAAGAAQQAEADAKAKAVAEAKARARAQAQDKARANAEANAVRSTDDVDEAARRLLFKQIQDAMNPDTSAAKEVATQQAEALLGSDIVNQRARAGRGGWQASGGQMAMEADIERAARMGLADKLIGIDTDAKQRGLDNALAAIGADVDLRNQASDVAIQNALLGLLGIEETPPEDPAAFDERNDAGVTGANTLDGFKEGNKVTAATGSYDVETGKRNPDDVSHGTISAGGKTYQKFLDSKASKPGKNVFYVVAQA